jgi:hypothetical protein
MPLWQVRSANTEQAAPRRCGLAQLTRERSRRAMRRSAELWHSVKRASPARPARACDTCADDDDVVPLARAGDTLLYPGVYLIRHLHNVCTLYSSPYSFVEGRLRVGGRKHLKSCPIVLKWYLYSIDGASDAASRSTRPARFSEYESSSRSYTRAATETFAH